MEAPILTNLATAVTNVTSITGLDGAISPEFQDDDTNYTYNWTGPGVTGATTKSLENLDIGTYSLIVTAPGNCTLEQDFDITIKQPFSVTSITGTPSCFNQNNGTLTATIEATDSVTINWWNQNTNTNIATENTTLKTVTRTGLPVGNYYLVITDVNNNTAQSDTFEILELQEVSATINLQASCQGTTTGSITFSDPVGSLADTYAYSINSGTTFQTEAVFNSLSAGIYTIHIRATDNANCDKVFTNVIISTAPEIFYNQANTIIKRASGPGANDGEITVSFTGGTPPFTYQWNGRNETTQTITGLSAGTYAVTVTDASSCSLTQENIEVTEVGPLTITNIIAIDATCKNEANGSITTTVTGEGTITYQWLLANGNAIPVSNGTNGASIEGILAGDYILTAIDDNATVTTQPITIGEPINALAISNITVTDVSCFGGNNGTLLVTANGGTPPYTYSIDDTNFQAGVTFNNLSADQYTVTVKDNNDCLFIQPIPQLISEPQELDFTITVQNGLSAANANDGEISVLASGGNNAYNYSWIGPNGYTATGKDINGLAAGDYILTLANALNCTLISEPITITEPGELIVTLTQTELLVCYGDSFGELIANAQGGVGEYTYQWYQVKNGNNNLLAEDTNIINNLSAGNYIARVTDENGISKESNNLLISQPNLLEITVDNTTDVLCKDATTGAISISVTGGTIPYQYIWSNGSTVEDISGLEAGEYSIEIVDSNLCSIEKTIRIEAPEDAVQISSAKSTNVTTYQADDGSITIAITGGERPYEVQWTRVSDGSFVGNQRSISELTADAYEVLITDANGCSITDSYEISQPDIVEETIVQPTCHGAANGSISVLVNKGNGLFTYQWNTGETTPMISALTAGTYTLTVTGFGNGQLTRTYSIENPIPIEVDLGEDRVLCAGQELVLDATVADENASYSWTSDNGFSSTAAIVTLQETANYTLTVQTATGCTAQGNIAITVSNEEIDANFAVSSQVFVNESFVAVDISYPLPESIEWIVPTEAKINKQNTDEIELSFSQPGEYEIQIITKLGNCIAQQTKKIIVIKNDASIPVGNTDSGRKLVEDFVVYPNSNSGKFTADIRITERGNVSVKVFSFANNALIASKKARGETTYSIPFDISGLPAGVYAVLLETPYGTSLRKVIVK